MKIGEDITVTCQKFYDQSPLGVAPTLFDFNEQKPKASNLVSKGKQKILKLLGFIYRFIIYILATDIIFTFEN